MRISFWKGILTGGILGAIFSMMIGSGGKNEKSGLFSYAARRTGSGAQRVLRGIKRVKW